MEYGPIRDKHRAQEVTQLEALAKVKTQGLGGSWEAF